MSETPNNQIRALVEDLDSKSDGQVEYEIEQLMTQAFRDGQASCAPWMQHKADCDIRWRCKKCGEAAIHGDHWRTDKPPCKFEEADCSCGLSAHLTPTGGETPADPRDRQAIVTFSRSDYEHSTKSDV